MTAAELLLALEPLGKDTYKRVLMKNHGVREPVFGVAISELKKFQKRIKKDYALAKELYATGNYDARYLAGLIADDARMTEADLNAWVKDAEDGCLAGSTVAWVAAGSPHGWKIALKWIESPTVHVAAAGWATLGSLVSIKPDADLDLAALKRLLVRVSQSIHQAPDRVRYQMNGFLVATGCHVEALTATALEMAGRIGSVTADLGPNSCRIPSAVDYILKVKQRGALGKKRKTAKC